MGDRFGLAVPGGGQDQTPAGPYHLVDPPLLAFGQIESEVVPGEKADAMVGQFPPGLGECHEKRGGGLQGSADVTSLFHLLLSGQQGT